jgi:hypothetical protein
LAQPAASAGLLGNGVFVDCDILQNPGEIERYRACAGDERRIRRGDSDTDDSRRLTQGFNLTISTSRLRSQGW